MNERQQVRERRRERIEAITKLLIPIYNDVDSLLPIDLQNLDEVEKLGELTQAGDILQELQTYVDPSFRFTKHRLGLVSLDGESGMILLRSGIPGINAEALKKGKQAGIEYALSLMQPNIPSHVTYGMAQLAAQRLQTPFESETLRHAQQVVHRVEFPTLFEHITLRAVYTGNPPQVDAAPRLFFIVTPIPFPKPQ